MPEKDDIVQKIISEELVKIDPDTRRRLQKAAAAILKGVEDFREKQKDRN